MFRYNYYISPKDKRVRLSALLFAAAFFLRLVWCLGWKENTEGAHLYTMGLLPLIATFIFPIFMLKYGESKLYLTFIPVLMGVVFFILKAETFLWWHQLLCTILYLGVAVLYGSVAWGIFPIRKLLIPLFGIPLAFHVLVEDPVFHRGVYDVSQWVQEASVVVIMAGLLLLALSIKEHERALNESTV